MPEREDPEHKFERQIRLEAFLQAQGWEDVNDVDSYISLHHVWLHTDLVPAEEARARALEEKYGAPPDFAIFNELPLPEPEVE